VKRLLFLSLPLGLWACDGGGRRNKDDVVDSALVDETCESPAPGPRLLRRLTHDEYDRSVTDLLGQTSSRGQGFAADDVVGGLMNNAGALDVSSLLADQLRAAAEAAAGEADLTLLVPCDPAELGNTACATVFIEDLGLRAFRRPLTQDDLNRYLSLWESVARDDGFDAGARWVITAMLQSPHFLYRMELGAKGDDGLYHLTGWERATALSYLFWGTTPDTELLDAAASGALDTDEGLRKQADRLAADPRAETVIAAFFEDWLDLDRLAIVSRDTTEYPELTATVREAMAGETRRLVNDLAASGATISDLLLARHSFITDSLAAYYGVSPGAGEADAEGFRKVTLDGEKYGGLLSQGAVLTTWALSASSSPVHRGLLVREHLLCQDLPPPPSNLNTSPPPVDPTLSTRERYATHATEPVCQSCHRLIDPIGFGFESYDGVGRWRSMDGEHPVDATGWIEGSQESDGEFDGLMELSALLATSPDVQRCYSRVWFSYAAGLYEEDSLTCDADAVAEAFAPGGMPLTGPQEALLVSQHLSVRAGEATTELDTPALGDRLPLDELPEDTGDWGEASAAEGNVDFEIVISSDWTAGYCADLYVTNNSETRVSWEVRTRLSGTPYTVWSSQYSEEADGTDVFIGESWNNTLDPGGSTQAGFCANR
jgi:hypothetical protein